MFSFYMLMCAVIVLLWTATRRSILSYRTFGQQCFDKRPGLVLSPESRANVIRFCQPLGEHENL